jgi:protein-arginine kinase activator protein McsA
MEKFFDTSSRILSDKNGNPDVARFIERISYEAYISLNGNTKSYCDELKTMMQNHVHIEQYEIAEGLRRAIKDLMTETYGGDE